MEINSGELVLYIDDKPVVACTGATFTVTNLGEDLPIVAPAVKEWVVEVSGKWPELTRMEVLQMEWLRASRLPRKKKKAYRKEIRIAYAAELHRQRVDEFLSKIGPEMN